MAAEAAARKPQARPERQGKVTLEAAEQTPLTTALGEAVALVPLAQPVPRQPEVMAGQGHPVPLAVLRQRTPVAVAVVFRLLVVLVAVAVVVAATVARKALEAMQPATEAAAAALALAAAIGAVVAGPQDC